MRFVNREDAATRLAGRLAHYRGQRPLVLGVPRGARVLARVVRRPACSRHDGALMPANAAGYWLRSS